MNQPRHLYPTGLRHWLSNATGSAEEPLGVADRLFRGWLAAGIRLLRANITMTTLHAEIFGFSYRCTGGSSQA